MRAAFILRQLSNEAKTVSPRERQTVADPFKYHTNPPSAFWDKFRKMLVVNPESSSGMQLNEVVRSPPPASAPTVQVTPASKASDPAENPYHERDFRRMYPRLEMVTQTDLSKLLIASPEQMLLPSPAPAQTSNSLTSVGSDPDNNASLASLYLSSTAASTSTHKFSPPKPPGKPHLYSLSEQPPHNKHAHFPMLNYR